MDEALLRKCDTMMKGIMKRTQAVHFSKPVDWKKMGLHEYPRIVKQPMDLGTVQERLARHHYTRLEELALDCRLVWVSERTHTPIRTSSARMSPRPARYGGGGSCEAPEAAPSWFCGYRARARFAVRTPVRSVTYSLATATHTPCNLPPNSPPILRCRPPRTPYSPSQKNAFLFNGPESVYFKAAKALSDAFEKKLEEIEREAEQINNPQLDTMERCRILLDDMTMNPFSEWFREPVDHENMGLTDYLQVIKEPQDLGTISKKLERTHYMSPEDYARDVRLVWQNAITYNSATSMCARQPRPRASGDPLSRRLPAYACRFGVVAAILWQTFDRRFALITNLASVDPGRPIPDRPGWPTFQQKKKFYDLCTKLTLADLNQMVSLVQRTCVAAVQNCGDKEVEVDVDELDMETFNKVMAWAQQKTKSVKAEH